MTRIRPTWTPPSSDSGGNASLGFSVSSDVAFTASGVWWFQPSDAGRPTTVQGQLYDEGSQALLADSGTVDATGFATGDWNFVEFADPFPCDPSTLYVVSCYRPGSIRYDGDDLAADIVSDDGHLTIPAHAGRFKNATGAAYPNTTWDGMHGVDLEYTVDIAPSEGDGALGVSLALAGVGEAGMSGDGAFGVGLALAGVGSVEHVGAGAVGVGLALAGVGARRSSGHAALHLLLAMHAIAPSSVGRPGQLTARGAGAGLVARRRPPGLFARLER